MNIFNSLGSNYNFLFVLRSLKKPKKNSSKNLKNLLEKKYEGRVVLAYKGRQALELALGSLKLEKDSKIAVTGFTCIAVIEAIEKQNLTPVYLDINPETLNFTPDEFELKIKSNKDIRGVIIQNTLGYPCKIEEILKVSRKHKIVLIEDLAHSIGTVYESGKEAGTVGDFACLSFSQDKAIDAVSGGAVITRNPGFVKSDKRQATRETFPQDKIYPLLTWVIRKTYFIGLGKVLHFLLRALRLLSNPMKDSGLTAMSDWHAGLALDGFERFEQTLQNRRKIAKIYADNLPLELLSNEIAKAIDQGTNLRFPIFLDNREKLVQCLKRKGVYISDIWYDGVVAPVKYLGLARYPKHSCPNAEKISNRILNLPTHINVSEKNAYAICRIINAYLNT